MTPFHRSFLKVLTLLIVAVIPVCSFASSADTLVPAGQHYLDMRGRVMRSEGQQRAETALDSAVVTLVNESGKTIWSGLTDAKGRLNLRLPLGKKFTMFFTKPGFIKKNISVDTHVTGDPQKNFEFVYDIDIFEKVEGLDVAVLVAPVAKIVYKPYDKTFTYDAAYTNKVNAGLQKMYREYYALKRKEEQLAASDSIATKPTGTKSAGTNKSVPYGQGKKPH